MNKEKSIFSVSILELILVLFFMYMVLTVYQMSFKDNHIDELEKTVESQREITQEIVKKEYPKLENKVADLINLEKYKKLYQEQMNKNSGMIYIENSIIGNLNDAERLKDFNKFENLIEVKNELNKQILELKGNKLTINTLNELNIQNEPLHRQIQYLEKKVKDNYQNKLNMANKLKDLKTNETVKYILLKLNKYDAPVQEQLAAIDQELKKLDKAQFIKNYNLERNYNKNTEYILKNLNQDNKPVENQIKVLKQVLENKKLLQKIKMLENQLANNQRSGNYTIDTSNIQRALNNLQNIKNNTSGKYDINTKDIIRKLNQENNPIENQIASLKKQLELEKNIKRLEDQKRELIKQLERDQKIKNALKNLQDIKNNTSGKYEPNTKEIIRELNQNNKPLEQQISNLKNQQELINKGKELENKLKGLENQIDNNQKIQKALKNLQDIKDGKTSKYEPNTNEILKELNQSNKPLKDQINELQKQVELGKNENDLKDQISDLKKQIDTNNKLKNPNIENENIQKALKNLQDIKNDTDARLEPNTKEIINELNQSNKPLDDQISELNKEVKLGDDSKLKDQISDLEKQIDANNKLKNPNIENENIQKALKNLQDIKNDTDARLDPDTKEILQEIDHSNKPLNEQIDGLKRQLELENKGDDLKEQIKELKKQIDNKNINDPEITDGKIKEALDNLEDIKNDTSIKYEPNTQKLIKELDQTDKPLDDQIDELKKELELGKKGKELENQIKELEKQLADNEIRNNPNINNENIRKALNNLQDIKNDISNRYDPNTKDILEKLKGDNKPLAEQIDELKKQIALDKKGERLNDRLKDIQKQIADDKKLKDSNIGSDDIQKALENLEDIKNGKTTKYDPITKEIIDKLDQSSKPLNEQIEKLKKHIDGAQEVKDLDKQIEELKKQIENNDKLKNPNVDNENIQKALKNLEDIKKSVDNKYEPSTKGIIKELNQTNKPLDQQINELRKQLSLDEKNKDIEDKIKDIQKQIADNKKSKNSNVSNEDIQKALENLEDIKKRINEANPEENKYKDKLKEALDDLRQIKQINEELSDDKDYKPKINKDIEETIKYLEKKEEQPDLKPSKNVQDILDRFNIKGTPSAEQLSDLYLYLYSKPVDSTNISELNFVINRLNDQNELENKIERINETIRELDRPRNSFIEEYVNAPGGNNTNNEIRTLKNQIKYLRKKIEKSGKLHMPCFLDDDGSTLYLFKLFLREDNIYVQMGWQEGVAQMAKGLPNLDKLVDKTLSLKEFMRLTKPIFEQSVKDECRQFVYFEDETVSKREYKRKTLTIEHHFYKYIEATW